MEINHYGGDLGEYIKYYYSFNSRESTISNMIINKKITIFPLNIKDDYLFN